MTCSYKNIYLTIDGTEQIQEEPREGKRISFSSQQTLRRYGTCYGKTQENEIKDAFKFYDVENSGVVNRKQLRSILGNFGFTKMNGK